MRGTRMDLAPVVLPEGEWTHVKFTVPPLEGDEAHEVGWRIDIHPADPPWAYGKVYVDDLTVTGVMDYTIDTSVQKTEFGQPTPFSVNDGETELRDGALFFKTAADGQMFSGNYYAGDISVEADAAVLGGDSAGLLLRGQGCRRYYFLGFSGENRVCIARWDSGERTELASAAFPWKHGTVYHMAAEAVGDTLSLQIDGTRLLEVRDGRFACGMFGPAHDAAAESRWQNFRIRASVYEKSAEKE